MVFGTQVEWKRRRLNRKRHKCANAAAVVRSMWSKVHAPIKQEVE